MTKLPEARLKITEKAFTQQVMHLLKAMGWKAYHTWRSVHSVKGFPDICAVKGERLLFAELKTEKGRVTPEQEEWLELLAVPQSNEVYLWRPSDWEEIVEICQK